MLDWSPRFVKGFDNDVLAGMLADHFDLISRSVDAVYLRRLSLLSAGSQVKRSVVKDHAEAVKAIRRVRDYLGVILEMKE